MANIADPGMQYAYHKTNDDCTLAFQTSLPLVADDASTAAAADARYRTCVLLLHGFSGSSAYFARNYAALSARFWVVAPDMRGHGRSGRPRGGYHVARLAADLRELVLHLRASRASALETVVPVGCSIGAAVLWTYVELFGCGDFGGFVFVDQAPLQDRSPFGGWGETRAHRGCYDAPTTRAAQEAWMRGGADTHRALVRDCLGYRHKPEPGDDVSDEQRRRDEDFFTEISAQCDGEWLAKLLADHTRYDHREALELITVPTLVMAGRRTGCFPLEGMQETVRRIEAVRPELPLMSVYDSGHWLFYEEPEKFNSEIINWVDKVIEARLPVV
ncbi:alpha/beta-hydrolase [Hypoxylon sp. FL1150]|nr:alpha/beta-hydrolase [Hypoxylon sp. FL1150]